MQRKNKGFNKQVVSLLICIIAAFALWVYVSYVEDPAMSRWQMGIPVTISGETKLNEDGLAIATLSNEKVDVKFSAPRSRFKYLSTDSVKATLDVSSISATGESEIDVIVTCSSEFTIVDQRKTTIKVNVEEYIKDKFFTIEPSITKNPDNGYFVKETHIDNKDMQISVSGAASYVNRVAKVVTSEIDLSTVADDATVSATFIPLDEHGKVVDNVKLNVESANLTFVIYKTASLPVEIAYYEGSDNPKMDCTPETDAVTVTGPAKVIDKLTSIKTVYISDYNYKSGATASVDLVIPESVTLFDRDTTTINLTFTKN